MGRIIANQYYSIDELESFMSRLLDEKKKHRLMIILHSLRAESPRQISEKMGMNKDTVTKWIKKFNEHGLDGLDIKNLGRPRKINYDEFNVALESNPQKYGFYQNWWTSNLIPQYFEKYQNLKLSEKYVYQLLKKLGYNIARGGRIYKSK